MFTQSNKTTPDVLIHLWLAANRNPKVARQQPQVTKKIAAIPAKTFLDLYNHHFNASVAPVEKRSIYQDDILKYKDARLGFLYEQIASIENKLNLRMAMYTSFFSSTYSDIEAEKKRIEQTIKNETDLLSKALAWANESDSSENCPLLWVTKPSASVYGTFKLS